MIHTRVAFIAAIVIGTAVHCQAADKAEADSDTHKDKRPRPFHPELDKRLGGRFFSTSTTQYYQHKKALFYRVVEKRPGARPFFGDGNYWEDDVKRGGARAFNAPSYSSYRAKRPGARAFYSPSSDLSGYYDNSPTFRRSDDFWSFRKKRLGGRAFYAADDDGYGGWIKKAAANDYWF